MSKPLTIITDEMFYQLCDYRMSEPLPLKDADLTEPFIYDRQFGVFYVDSGYHMLAACLLYAWRHGEISLRELMKSDLEFKTKVKENSYSSQSKYEYVANLYYLDLKGTAMGSSVGDAIEFGRLSNLNEEEKQIFGRYRTRELADILGL